MTIIYKSHTLPDTTKEYMQVLLDFGKSNWKWQQNYNWYMIFYKQEKKTITQNIDNESPEYIEFITAYRKINNKWSYDDRLINKYHKAIKEKSHKEIMENLQDYKKHLKAFNKPALQAPSYLNSKRYLDNWETTKVNFLTKWRDDLLKQRQIPPEYVEIITLEANKRDNTYKDKEMTIWTFENIISKYYLKN